MVRVLMLAAAAFVCSGMARGQQLADMAGKTLVGEFPSRPELLRRIGLYEVVARRAEAEHSLDPRVIDVYLHLGGMYEDAAMYPKANDALLRAVAMLRRGPGDKLAAGIDHLALLHGATGELRRAEKEEQEALRLRETAGDRAGVALSMSSLAQLAYKQKHYAEAVGYAVSAMVVIGNDATVDVAERIAVRQLLADGLCKMGLCARAVPLLREAIDLAAANYGAGSLPAALAGFHLGYAFWQMGDVEDASSWMQRGTAGMQAQFGWGHPIYLTAMRQYAQFLREHGRAELASSVESQVRRSEAVVDVRSFTRR